jgi:hypothetical protein
VRRAGAFLFLIVPAIRSDFKLNVILFISSPALFWYDMTHIPMNSGKKAVPAFEDGHIELDKKGECEYYMAYD